MQCDVCEQWIHQVTVRVVDTHASARALDPPRDRASSVGAPPARPGTPRPPIDPCPP